MINNNVFVKVVVALFFDMYLMWVLCVVVGLGTVFFIIDRIVVHKGLRYFSSPLSLSCVRMRACTCTADSCDLRVLSCRVGK